MPTSTAVKFFRSDMAGAPVLSGTVGAAITLLDACLVNGWGLVTLDTLTVTGGVATGAAALGHLFPLRSVVKIEGATPSALNGEHRVKSATANSFSFEVEGVEDGAATGTITAKLAPLGFEKSFSGGNVAAYRQVAPGSSGFYLRVDDNAPGTAGAREAYTFGCEEMATLDSHVSRFPTSEQRAGGIVLRKSDTLDAGARLWVLVGDDRAFYLITYARASGRGEIFFFGDLASYKQGDSYSCAIGGRQTPGYTGTTNMPGIYNHFNRWSRSLTNGDGSGLPTDSPWQQTADAGAAAICRYLARDVAGAMGSVPAGLVSGVPAKLFLASTAAFVLGLGGGMAFPNPSDGGLYLSPCAVLSGLALRGVWPGLYDTLHPTNAFEDRSVFENAAGMDGRAFMFTALSFASSSTEFGSGAFFDITGPWR